MEKTYKYIAFGEKHDIVLRKSTYSKNGTLAIVMVEVEFDGFEEPYANLTVNLPQSDTLCANGKCQFIDTNNLGWDILEWLSENGIAEFTGTYGQSGFCDYPLVLFKQDFLSSIYEI